MKKKKYKEFFSPFLKENIDFCNGKPCYDKKSAMSAKNKRFKEDHIKLRIYHCDECNHWHLTSKL